MNKKNRRKHNNVIDIINKCKKIIYNYKDPNSISSQLGEIVFIDTVYRSFNEGLRLDKNNKKRPKQLIDLFHSLYFNNQVVNIRRLLYDHGKDVCSLRRVLDIISKNQDIFTRRGYLLANTYQIAELEHEKLKESQYEFLNCLYDNISNTISIHDRTDDDKLNKNYLKKIDEYLNKETYLLNYTNSYITHCFNQNKRNTVNCNLNKITLGKLRRTLKIIAWLTYTLSKYIGKIILFEVPTIQYDQFEGWSGSIFKNNIDNALNRYWVKRIKLFESWKIKYWDINSFYLTPYKKLTLKNNYHHNQHI